MNSIMITCSPSTEITLGCVIWILDPSFMTLRPMISTKTLLAMLRLGSIDRSGYSCSHPLSMRVNKKAFSLIKDELGERIMTEFMAPRLKLYVYRILSGSSGKKCKGVKKCNVKKMLNFDDYKQCLFAGQNTFRKQLLFQNRLHEVYTVEVNKLALSKDNDKQVIQSDGVSTLAHGYDNAASHNGLGDNHNNK